MEGRAAPMKSSTPERTCRTISSALVNRPTPTTGRDVRALMPRTRSSCAASGLKREVPELSYIVAHGQLAAGDLDERMNAFYDGKADVLLATTIVESGLDIPTANTLIVWRADLFGLAQLYQIRGRVGRSKTRAYAYLTTKPRLKLTPQAERRLKVLGSIDSLGAGFQLASQDLDIRGAGNLLGEEQSGQIREVGFELYQSMLADAILAAKAGATFVSPFVGRLDDVAHEGMRLIADIVEIYENYPAFRTEVLVASVRHPGHVVEAARLGAHVATLPPSVIRQLFRHPLTDKGLEAFLADWARTGQRIV